MTPLDLAIRKVLDQRPKPRNLDEISRAVEADLPAKLRKKLTPPSSIALYRLIRRRVRAILRHDDRQQMLPGIQDHYSTETKDVWVGREEMNLETAMWNLDRLDRRRRAAEAEYAALASWIAKKFPDARREA